MKVLSRVLPSHFHSELVHIMEAKRLVTAVALSVLILLAWERIRAKYFPSPVQQRIHKMAQEEKTQPIKAKTAITTKEGQQYIEGKAKPNDNITLGNAKRGNAFNVYATMTSLGASVKTVQLSQFSESVRENNVGYKLLSEVKYPQGTRDSLTTEKIVISKSDGKKIEVGLDHVNWFYKLSNGENGQSVQFYLDIWDKSTKKPLLRITKTYKLKKKSYDLEMNIDLKNLSGKPLTAEIYQLGPIGVRKEDPRSDYRKIFSGIKLGNNAEINVKKITRKSVLRNPNLELPLCAADEVVLWSGQANKYFLAIMNAVNDKDKLSAKSIKTVRAMSFSYNSSLGEDLTTVWVTKNLKVDAKSQASVHFEIYLGPKSDTIFNATAKYHRRNYQGTMEYTWCTMQWLAEVMIKLMKALYLVTHNYGFAIILMVLIVRLILHPITKSSQMNMMRMQRDMQKLQPKVQALKEKYKNNRQAMNKAMMDLYKEEGINPAGQMLGCLPMMLQMPIWIALWTSLNNTFELRHEKFIFWIKDLAGPDSLIHLSTPIHLPLISGMIGAINDINVLPLLLVISMLLQQKFMAQPTAPDADPSQAKQQKVMFYFMGIFFGFILYNAPSGLNLYILTSNFLGVIENKRIRKHLADEQEKGISPKKRAPSLWARFQKRIETYAADYEQQRTRASKKKKKP